MMPTWVPNDWQSFLYMLGVFLVVGLFVTGIIWVFHDKLPTVEEESVEQCQLACMQEAEPVPLWKGILGWIIIIGFVIVVFMLAGCLNQ